MLEIQETKVYHSRKRTYSIYDSYCIHEHPYYSQIIGDDSSPMLCLETKLHSDGALARLMKSPRSYPRSTICIVSIGEKPVCSVSYTYNKEKVPLLSGFSGEESLEYVFPNAEIMAFTLEKYRGRGIAGQAIKRILKGENFPVTRQIYVYSKTMKAIIERAGFPNVFNLHESSD